MKQSSVKFTYIQTLQHTPTNERTLTNAKPHRKRRTLAQLESCEYCAWINGTMKKCQQPTLYCISLCVAIVVHTLQIYRCIKWLMVYTLTWSMLVRLSVAVGGGAASCRNRQSNRRWCMHEHFSMWVSLEQHGTYVAFRSAKAAQKWRGSMSARTHTNSIVACLFHSVKHNHISRIAINSCKIKSHLFLFSFRDEKKN